MKLKKINGQVHIVQILEGSHGMPHWCLQPADSLKLLSWPDINASYPLLSLIYPENLLSQVLQLISPTCATCSHQSLISDFQDTHPCLDLGTARHPICPVPSPQQFTLLQCCPFVFDHCSLVFKRHMCIFTSFPLQTTVYANTVLLHFWNKESSINLPQRDAILLASPMPSLKNSTQEIVTI